MPRPKASPSAASSAAPGTPHGTEGQARRRSSARGADRNLPHQAQWLTTDEMATWSAFLDTSNLMQRKVAEQLKRDGGVTQLQYELMTRLAERPDRQLRMSDLADLLSVSRGGLTYQVGQLEGSGLVQRRASEVDGRVWHVHLTDAGHETLTRAAPGHVQLVRENMIDLLSLRQRRALVDALAVVRDHLRAER